MKFVNKLSLNLILLSFLLACHSTNKSIETFESNRFTKEKKDDPIDIKVKNILSRLSLEDKIGEMTQLSIDVLSVGKPYNLDKPHSFDTEKLEKVLVDLKVGSILNVGGYAYTRKYWYEIHNVIQDYAMKRKASGIPVLYGIDAIHGTNYTVNATLFPQQLGQASTWNTDLALSCGEVTAYETMASGIPWTFSPVLDLGIDPRWPRLYETYGEDVHLASEMGKAYVQGLQGEDIADKYKVAACLKHFVGYSYSRRGKDRMPAWIPDRMMREYFLPTFQAAIDADAKTVMICSGEVNGVPVHASKRLLVDILRDEMGFEGLTVSDWEDVNYLHTRHRIAKNFKDAIRIAINAGIDMAMVPMDTDFPVLLKELVEEGKVSEQRINEAVTRILKLKVELGLFENPYFSSDEYMDFASPKHRSQARDASDESIIMLENRNILPLSKNAKLIVAGPTAKSMRSLNGGWTGTWQGDDPEYFTPNAKTVYDAIESQFGASQVKFANALDNVDDYQDSDVIILCLGEQSYTEKPGDIEDLSLPSDQLQLFNEAANSGLPVIVVLLEGRPRIVYDIKDKANAVLLGLYPGDFGSESIAKILAGSLNPSGKLPITYPSKVNDLVNYNHKGTDLMHRDFSANAFQPAWEFGHGLSYSDFKYSNLELSSDTITLEDKLTISISVKNASTIEGKEVVQLYITDKFASITPAVKSLKAFKKINIAPNATAQVKFEVSPDDLRFVGIDHTWINEEGWFEVEIGNLKQKFYLKK